MITKNIIHIDDMAWQHLRKDLTEDVLGKPLIPESLTNVNITLTKVQQGGSFAVHVDPYHHIFYFLQGIGEGLLGKKTYQITPGTVVHIPAGEQHGYKNTGTADLILLTINIPKS